MATKRASRLLLNLDRSLVELSCMNYVELTFEYGPARSGFPPARESP